MKKIILFFFVAISIIHVVANDFERCNNFNLNWKFHLGEVPGFMTPNFDDQSWRTLELPHDWAIEGVFDEANPAGESGGFFKNGIGCYRKSFQLPESLKGMRISIRFDGVYMNRTVYINGTYLTKGSINSLNPYYLR